MPSLAQLAGQRHGPLGGSPQRVERGDLRADVDVQPHRLEPRLSGVIAIELPHLLERHAELVRLEPRGDVRVALGVDVRIHAQRDPHRRRQRHGARGDAVELSRRLGVDRLHAQRHGAVQLVAGLAHAGEDDLIGDEPGAQRHFDLASRVGIGLGAERPQQAHQRQRRVRFERIVDGVGMRRQPLGKGAIRAVG